MGKRFQFRFQHWVLATTLAMVLVMTTAFLVTVFGKFHTMAEQNAQERLGLVSQRVAIEIGNLMERTAGTLVTLAGSEPELFLRDGRINGKDLVPTMMAAVAANATAYGYYFGLANDEFVQLIGVRRSDKVVAALQAPPETWFAVRRSLRGDDGKRTEYWSFLDEKRQAVGSREVESTYAPTGRPWYAGALRNDGLFVAPPYVFASNKELGVTLAAPLANKAGVLGSDISLAAIDNFLASLELTPNGALVMLDESGGVIGFSGRGGFAGMSIAPLTPLADIQHPAFAALKAAAPDAGIIAAKLKEAPENIVVVRQQSRPVGGSAFTVVALAPVADFAGPIERARRDVVLVSLTVLAILLPLALLGSRRVVNALTALASNSESIKRLDFATEPKRLDSFLYELNALGDAQVVMQRSIKQRTEELDLAQQKLARLVDNGLLLAREQDRDKLLQHILAGGREIANCAAGTLFLKTERETLRFAMRTLGDKLPDFEVPLYHAETRAPMLNFVSSYVATKNETVRIDDVYSETRFDLTGTKRFSEKSGFRTVSMLTVPLSPRAGEVLGVLQLMNALDPQTGEVIPFPADLVSFVEALAAQSAVALENHNLLEAQKALVDSLIRIIAGAIDAKSAYTGGHCERVPELAIMLAEEACKVDSGPLADFRFATDDEWREFRIGAWLHDCGKVTTPEYVVDKATKLETIYNRIHEVRTRFEVLLRDARIACLEALAGGQPAAAAEAAWEVRKAELLDDFAFVAECNVGGEFMAPERVERLRRIAAQNWVRHFDDRQGLGDDELRRYANVPAAALPAAEPLLGDKPWHVVPRLADTALDPKFGFQVKVPDNLYNFGELYNLCISRGTLTEEERFKINEHIIQTIVMLDRMPFPKHLKRVPEYAGTHHETMIGTGYPRKLDAAGLSIPSRIMAIADIFEALTASDRPYKKGKTLSESVKILSFFKKDKHIDPVLFDLFLASGIYKRYAERYLKPEQIDEVDVTKFVG